LNEVYPVGLNEQAEGCFPEKLWDVSSNELQLAKSLDKNCPQNGEELVQRAWDAGCGDLFPRLSDTDLQNITEDGKIPKQERWASRIRNGELAIDTLLNLAGLASFASDQAQLDERIKQIITSKK
jgi:transaldolase